MAQMNPREHNFAVAGINEAASLEQNIGQWSAAKLGAHLWNNAVGTIEQATILNLEKSSLVLVEPADAISGAHHAKALKLGRKVSTRVYDGGNTGQRCHLIGVGSCRAPHDANLRAGIFTAQSTNHQTRFGVGVVCDGAGINDAKVCWARFLGNGPASRLQHFDGALGFVLISTATKRDEAYPTGQRR